MTQLIKQERRKRSRRPLLLILAANLLLLLGVLNYVGLATKYHIPFWQFPTLVSALAWKEGLLLLLILISGVGLLLIRLWGWAVFTLSAAAWVVHNLVYFMIYPNSIAPGPVIQTILVLFLLVYFLRKDIYSPYFSPHRMGWRLFRRYPLSLDAQVNDIHLSTKDISRGGAFLLWPDSDLEQGESVQIRVNVGGFWFSSEGGVASIRPGEGVGIAFRKMDEFTSQELDLRLHALYRAFVRASSPLKK